MPAVHQKKSGQRKPAGREAPAAPPPSYLALEPFSESAPVLQAKCACGGGCPSCREKTGVQPKLAISSPGDPYEREADRAADQVMRMADARPQLQATSGAGGAEPAPSVHQALRSTGRPLDPATHHFFSQRFGQDFSHVRIHSGSQAAESARDINALAYTVGRDIVFRDGHFAPGTAAGRRLLAHELAHVVQQQGGAREKVQRAVFQVGNLTIKIDYGGLTIMAAADRPASIEATIGTFTGSPATAAMRSDIAALTPDQQRWLIFGLRLLTLNTTAAHAALNRVQAVERLIAHAPSALHQPLAAADRLFEREALRVSGWFEVALTEPLSAPTGTTATDINIIVNPPPSSGSATDPLDVAELNRRLVPALEHLLRQIDPANITTVGTRSIAAFQALGDVLLEEARAFFSPWADTAIANLFDLAPRWHASANIFDVTAITPTQDQRIGYLLNRAEIVGRNTDAANPVFNDTNIFADVHFDSSRPADRAELLSIATTMEADPAVQPIVDRLIQHTGRKTGQGPTTRIGLVTEFDTGRFTACEDHWRGIDTLCHELLHALVHADFVAAAGRVGFPQVIREGFTEVLGVQLFNDHVRPKAAADAAFKATLEAGVSGAPCPAPAAATIGYGSAGSGAEEIRTKVGNDNFRAAYFLGRPDLAGV